MKTSSFLLGVLLGAVSTSLMLKNGGSAKAGLHSNSGGMLEKARYKLMDTVFPGMGGAELTAPSLNNKEKQIVNKPEKTTGSGSKKQENLNMLKEFIRSNPDAKREVEQILKETNTVVPGL